ncbi:hypothetical protein L6164_019763 [Bauhinia variegata]|uniref:Uncharacterized protein n=1 Tax=Bauhinia variegata TaxID=167791 RepID=A0ACB9MSV2_BAUVA|nr:hypothetical protein L6164_019763 [Bauhinia variegata]
MIAANLVSAFARDSSSLPVDSPTSMEEESWTNWLCNLESNDYNFINEWDINADDRNFPSNVTSTAPLHEENSQPCFSADSSHCSYATLNVENCSTMSNSSVDESSLERPAKLLKITSTENLSPKQDLACFDNVNAQIYGHRVNDSGFEPKDKVSAGNIVTKSSTLSSKGTLESQKNETRNSQECKRTNSVTRTPSHAQDHMIAERLRREKIAQQFIALSALIPGLKKMDKASVLGDAIKYVKQLQEHVKLLEEQTKRRSIESVVFVKKSHLSTDEDISDTSSNSCNDPCKWNRSLPEVEARVSENDVLIRIHCAKQKGLLINILREIDNLNLSVINTSVLPFGTSILDITIVAQMQDEFRLTVKELATNLRVALVRFTSGNGVLP